MVGQCSLRKENYTRIVCTFYRNEAAVLWSSSLSIKVICSVQSFVWSIAETFRRFTLKHWILDAFSLFFSCVNVYVGFVKRETNGKFSFRYRLFLRFVKCREISKYVTTEHYTCNAQRCDKECGLPSGQKETRNTTSWFFLIFFYFLYEFIRCKLCVLLIFLSSIASTVRKH